MADKTSGSPKAQSDFEEFLKTAPEADDPAAAAPVVVTGMVMRSKETGLFTLQTDAGRADIPSAAVEGFEVASSGEGGSMVRLSLNRGHLTEDILGKLGIPKQILDTLKEIGGGDTIKEQPWDTLKELGGDTRKEQVFDTLKEAGGDTIKEPSFETLKELGEGTGAADTLVEGIQPGDPTTLPQARMLSPDLQAQQLTFKEIAKELPKEIVKEIHKDIIKELPKDFKELPKDFKELPKDFKELPKDIKEIPKDFVGEGTGFADTFGGGTLAEMGGQLPGGGTTQPAAAAFSAQAAPAAGLASQPTLKPFQSDTIKELTIDHTIKELIQDPKYIKELVKELPKEVAWEGPGGGTIYEGIGGGFGPVATNPAAGGVPFVLATPHQASQGAVAQQALAAQAMMGRLGY